jgi:hypothetical protein
MHLLTLLAAQETRQSAASWAGPAINGRPLAPTREGRVSNLAAQAMEQTSRWALRGRGDPLEPL